MEKEPNLIIKDIESSRNQQDFNNLFVKMLEDKKQNNSKDEKESRIKNINRYLKSTQNFRSLGLIALQEFLELHSVVSSSFTTEKECQELEWLETILRMVENKIEDPEKCFPILSKLIIITTQHPDMHKIIQGKYLSKIIDCIISNAITVSTLECLAACLKEYSGTCGIFKNKIYDYCISSIDTMDSSLNGQSGKCLHLLQQTRGGTTHKKNWAEYHEKLLNTLEELFINLLQTGESINSGKSERLKLPEDAETKKNLPLLYKNQERFIRFQNICIFLNVSLVYNFPAPKSILLDWIMTFLDKSIMVNQAQINKKDRLLPFVLNIEVHKCLLNILQSIMKAVGKNIIIYSKDICDTFWRCLKSTNVPYDEFKIKEITSLRSTIYDVIVEFMKISPNNHFISKNMENFLKEAFLDITPMQTEILLTLPNKNDSKKKKKRDPEVKRTLSGKTYDNCILLHQELCIKSLNFLNNLLIHNGAGIKPVLFKILTDKILIVAYKFLSKNLTQQELYHSSECRLMILEVIYNILINPAVRNATPSSFMIELLRKFKDNDKNEKLRYKASEMIRTVEAILHNRKDPIHFPPDLKDFRDSWLFNEKTVKAFAEITNEGKENLQVIDIDSDNEENSNDNLIEIEHSSSTEKVDDISSDKHEDNKEEVIQAPTAKTKRLSTSKIDDEIPRKIAKETIVPNVSEKNESNEQDDDILNSYMADFCDG